MTVRAVRFLIAATLIALVAPRGAGAQAIRTLLGAPKADPAFGPFALRREVAVPPSLYPATESSIDGRRIVTTSVSVVGGAALGAWLGYFLSQVVKSDWEGQSTGERAGHRRTFAISGAAVGALSGYLIRPRGRRSRPDQPGIYVYVAPSARHYITRQELRRTLALSALEAVQMLRPEWLASGQIGAPAMANGSASLAGEASIAVYVVDTRVGGSEVLGDITILEVEELRLYEAREAERRWGVTLPLGAIEVVPAAARIAK